MNEFYISLAGFTICIKIHPLQYHPTLKLPLLEFMKKMLKNFILSKKPATIDGTIEFKDQELYKMIIQENTSFAEICTYINRKHLLTSCQISFSQLITIFSLFITNLLKDHTGFLLHASACLINGKAYIFVGKEGAGKSTMITLLKKKFKPLCDDQVIIRNVSGTYYLYQNPYVEKTPGIIKSPQPYVIGNIYTLKQAAQLTVTPYKKQEKIPRLLEHLLLPEENKNNFIQTLFNFSTHAHNVFDIGFRLDAKELYTYFSQLS